MVNDEVERLLAASMVAHQQALAARHQKQFVQAQTYLTTARDRRLEAHALDPEHTAPAWSDTSTKGRERHEDLMDFYDMQLGTPF